MSSKKPTMAEELDLPELPPDFKHMVSNHLFTLHGGGHGIRFEPGKPIPVHRSLQAQALAHGATVIGAGDATVLTQPVGDPQKDPASDEYRAAVRGAAEALLIRNSPHDFGANGKPYADAWQKELGWKPVQSIRDEIWDEVKTAAVTGA